MYLFLCEMPSNRQAMQHFARLSMQAGKPFAYLDQPAKPEPSAMAVKHCPHSPEDIGGFSVFQHARITEELRPTHYGEDGETILQNATLWYATYYRVLQNLVYGEGIDHLVTWGSGVIGNKAAILAARDLGLRVSAIEDGLFPARAGDNGIVRTVVVSEGAAYYESDVPGPNGLGEPETWRQRYDAARFRQYRKWWMQSQTTKYTGTSRWDILSDQKAELPIEWYEGGPESRIVWMDQLEYDAGMYWRATPADTLAITQAALENGVWHKGHPFRPGPLDLPKGIRRLPPTANIHSILPDASEVWAVTSNALLEAWMYERETAIFGNPFFREVPEDTRDHFLDCLIHEGQCRMDDPEGFVKLLDG